MDKRQTEILKIEKIESKLKEKIKKVIIDKANQNLKQSKIIVNKKDSKKTTIRMKKKI